MNVLVTSPHSPEERGGLATFTANILQTLSEIGESADLCVFKTVRDESLRDALKKDYQLVVNIHYMALYAHAWPSARVINFVHGSEICLTSPNPLKALYKKIFKKKFLSLLERSDFNVFISEFTQQVAYQQGLAPSYERDLIIPNGIAIDRQKFSSPIIKSLDQEKLIICCIARDVPHKNIDGVVSFCEYLSEVSAKAIELWLAPECKRTSRKITIRYIDGSNQERDELYLKAHFNLLLSKNHQAQGFFEGFGLVILEAALYGTPSIGMEEAGIKESIHDGQTGWLISEVSQKEVARLWNSLSTSRYQEVSKQAFSHTLHSHGLEGYEYFFRMVLS